MICDPVAWARTRGANRYTPDKQRAYRGLIIFAARAEMRGKKPFVGPIAMDYLAVFAVPKSWSKTRKASALHQDIYPTARPDLDNLAKLAADALNGIVYRDDAQIVTAKLDKIYGPQPKVVITVMPK
jgi:Holliday junction resolvase RusA-like endonuclease